MFTVYATFAGIFLVLTTLGGWTYFHDGRGRTTLAITGIFLAAFIVAVVSAVDPGLVVWLWWVPMAGFAAVWWLKRHDPALPKPK